MTLPEPIKTGYFNYFGVPLGVPETLETGSEALWQILTFGNALGIEL